MVSAQLHEPQETTMADEAAPKYEPYDPPTSDQEFDFTDVASAPAWIDKNWASWSMGPALALPAGDIFGTPPYTTIIARVGDKVLFKAATPSKAAHFEVVQGEPTGDQATVKIPQVSNASLEDMLKGGSMAPDELSDEAKGQVISRSPQLTKLVEEGKGAPEPVAVTDMVKTS
jgi:hypothetical protein